MFKKIKIKRSVKFALVMIFAISMVGFVQKKQQEKTCNRIIINIEQQYDNYFINERDVMKLMTENGREKILGTPFDELDLKAIESRIREHKFILHADVFKDVTGNLVVHAVQSMPVARVVQAIGPDAYISKDGKILPVSDRFTARVVVINGQYTRKLVEKDLSGYKEGIDLLNMLLFINKDDFWRAQIAEIDVDRDQNMVLLPQVGKQTIIFGKAAGFEKKFKKLKIFYKEILPQKGWAKYEKVNVKFENQIVCE